MESISQNCSTFIMIGNIPIVLREQSHQLLGKEEKKQRHYSQDDLRSVTGPQESEKPFAQVEDDWESGEERDDK